MKKSIILKNKLTSIQKFLIFAMALTPFTSLRPTAIGIGEFIFILVFFREFKKSINQKKINFFLFSRFWLTYLSLTIIGFVFNGVFLGFKNIEINSMFFDFTAFTVVFMTCFIFEKLLFYRRINTYLFLKYVFFLFSTILTTLFIISFYRSSLFGFSLIYAGKFFVPFTNNLHQISMFLTPLIFVGLLVLKIEKNKFLKLLIIIMIVTNIIMDFNVGSSKAELGVYVGGLAFLITSIIKYFNGQKKTLFILIVLIILTPIIILNLNYIKKLGVDYFEENDGSDGRAILYTDALKIGLESPLFGYGPGPHIPGIHNKLWDAHQTFIAVFLQTGILGLFLFVILFLKIMKRLINNPYLFAAFIPIFIYASGGDVLRKLSIWIFLILFYYYNEDDEKKYLNQEIKHNL